jgi:O-antigen/teichoic acid export membrane protein
MRKISDISVEIKRLFPILRNAILYFGGTFLQLIIAVFTSPIFARNLSAEEFGIIGYYESVKLFVLPLTTLSLTFFYLFKYFKQNTQQNKKLLSNILLFLTFSNIIVICISSGIIYTYIKIAKIEIPFAPFAFIMLISLFLEVYKTFFLMDLKLKKAAFTYFLYTAILAIFNIAISLLFVVIFRWGAAGRMFGALVALFIVSFIFIKQFDITLNIKLDFKLMKEGLRWAFPMILSAYFYLPMANIDKLLLATLKDTNELGYYSIGDNISGYIGIAAYALFSAFEPDFYKFVAENNKRKFFFYSVAFVLINALMIILFFILSEFLVNYLTSGRYTRAYVYANYFAASIFIMIMSLITNTILIALGKSRFQLYINIIAGCIGFILYKYFIHHYGFLGATYGRIAAAFIYLITQTGFIAYTIYKPKPKLK